MGRHRLLSIVQVVPQKLLLIQVQKSPSLHRRRRVVLLRNLQLVELGRRPLFQLQSMFLIWRIGSKLRLLWRRNTVIFRNRFLCSFGYLFPSLTLSVPKEPSIQRLRNISIFWRKPAKCELRRAAKFKSEEKRINPWEWESKQPAK